MNSYHEDMSWMIMHLSWKTWNNDNKLLPWKDTKKWEQTVIMKRHKVMTRTVIMKINQDTVPNSYHEKTSRNENEQVSWRLSEMTNKSYHKKTSIYEHLLWKDIMTWNEHLSWKDLSKSELVLFKCHSWILSYCND